MKIKSFMKYFEKGSWKIKKYMKGTYFIVYFYLQVDPIHFRSLLYTRGASVTVRLLLNAYTLYGSPSLVWAIPEK